VSEVHEGRWTGHLVGDFLHGPAKTDAVRRMAKERGYDLSRCAAYTDSINDLPLSKASDIRTRSTPTAGCAPPRKAATGPSTLPFPPHPRRSDRRRVRTRRRHADSPHPAKSTQAPNGAGVGGSQEQLLPLRLSRRQARARGAVCSARELLVNARSKAANWTPSAPRRGATAIGDHRLIWGFTSTFIVVRR
jgi:hypothetical protein